MKNLAALLTLLALACLAYETERSPGETSTVHADELPRWSRVETPLTIRHDDIHGITFVQGFWLPANPAENKQPTSPVAATIECTRYNKTCGVFEASVSQGVLQAQPFDYYVGSWTKDGIEADDFDEGVCGLHHHLSR